MREYQEPRQENEEEYECQEDHNKLIEEGFIGCPKCKEYFGND